MISSLKCLYHPKSLFEIIQLIMKARINRSFIYLLAISLIQYVFDKRFENIEKCMGYLFDFVLKCNRYAKVYLFRWPILSFPVEENSLIDTSTTFRYFMFSPSFFHRLYTQKRAIQSHYETVYIIKNIVD